MRHRVAGKTLNRPAAARTALRRNLVTESLRHESIQTTRTKAQAIRGRAEKPITLAKHGLAAAEQNPESGVHARRMAAARLNDPEVVQKLFEEIAPRYAQRDGGYTRMLNLGLRKGDAAPIVLLQLVEEA